MVESLSQIISEVDTECRRRSIPMLGPQKAARLVELVRDHRPKVIVEVGTAIGYSGLWIADVLDTGKLITLELDPERAEEAARVFRRAGLDQRITQVVGDA